MKFKKKIRFLSIFAVLIISFLLMCSCTNEEVISKSSLTAGLSQYSFVENDAIITLDNATKSNTTTTDASLFVTSNQYGSVVNIMSLFLNNDTVYCEVSTGFFINENGYILASGEASYDQTMHEAKLVMFSLNSPYDNSVLYEAELISYNISQNISILKPKNTFNHKDLNGNIVDGIENFVTMTPSTSITIGSSCTFIRNDNLNPYIVITAEITTGIISQNPSYDYISFASKNYNYIQISCAMADGGNGGALFDNSGYLIGMGCKKVDNTQKMNLALSSELLVDYVSYYNNKNNSKIKIYLATSSNGGAE